MRKVPMIVDFQKIKADLARAFAGLDKSVSEVQRMIGPAPIADPGHIDQDPRFRLAVVPGESPELPTIIELHEVSPAPKLVGFVELAPGKTFELIELLADRLGLEVYVAHKGNA